MTQHRFGFAALAGAPNVGKSTLLNRIIGKKISIISKRPQTTRHRILGVKTLPKCQIVFVDTPGLHNAQKKSLNKVINQTAIRSLIDVDVILFMIDYKGWSKPLTAVFQQVKSHAISKGIPIILLINKIDRLKDKTQLLPLIDESKERHNFAEILPISALKLDKKKDSGTNDNMLSHFLDVVTKYLPLGDAGFPCQQITDRSERFLAAELVREQTFMTLGQELPYSIAAEVEQFETNDKGVLCVDIIIWVEKSGQKSIVIGKDGQQIKTIGMNARKQMEQSFNKKVYLKLWVKVKKGWADRATLLHSLGYAEH